MYRTVLLFGAPGVGKGTQGRLLGCIPGFRHVATGDIFRALDRSTEQGRTFFDYSARGELVPDEVTIRIWRDHMNMLIQRGEYNPDRDLLLLDGIPRNVNQATAMQADIDVLLVVHLIAADEANLLARMQRRARREGRHDDAQESVIRRRWEVYRAETRPVLDHYGRDRCAEINAIGTPGHILHDVLNVVVPVQEEHFANALE